MKEWTEAAKIGAISVNEFRTKMLNLPPMEGGNVALRPLNFESVEGDTSNAGASAYRGASPPKKVVRANNPQANKATLDESKAVTSNSKSGWTRKDVWNLHARQVKKAQASFEIKIDKLFRKMYRSAADSLANGKHSLHSELSSEIFDKHQWSEELFNTAGEEWVRAAIEGAVTEMALFELVAGKNKGYEFSVADDVAMAIPPKVLRRLKTELTEIFEQPYWTGILRTTQADIQNLIDGGIQNGLSINQVERQIRGDLVGGRHPAIRANAMARTEMGGALNAGHHAVMENMASEGLVKGKQWLSICGNTSREHHCSLTGEQVGVEENFPIGSEEAPYPAHHMLSARNRINCQCTTLSVTILEGLTPDDEVVMPGEEPRGSNAGMDSVPVSDAISYRNVNDRMEHVERQTKDDVKQINKAIDRVHSDGNLSKIKVSAGDDAMAQGRTRGVWRRELEYDEHNYPRKMGCEIRLKKQDYKVVDSSSTLTHEIGHALDFDGIPMFRPKVGSALAEGQTGATGGGMTWTEVMNNSMKKYSHGEYTATRKATFNVHAFAKPANVAKDLNALGVEMIPEVSEKMEKLRKALNRTQTIKNLRKRSNQKVQQTYTNQRGDVYNTKVNKKYVRYVLKDQEQFANAYSQFIAKRGGDKKLLANINATLEKQAAGNGVYSKLWQWDDFDEVDKAFAELFETLGWMK